MERNFAAEAVRLGTTAACFQSNHEGHLIEHPRCAPGWHAARHQPDHTSVALRDALAGVTPAGGGASATCTSAKRFATTPTSGIADGVLSGLGIQGYEMALHYLVRKLASMNAAGAEACDVLHNLGVGGWCAG